MSSITITPAFVPSRPVTRLRMTVRGRRVLLAAASVPLIAGIAVAALSGGAALASGDAGATTESFETVTVLPGDTLWGIAEEIAPQADPRSVIDELESLNGLRGGVLAVGTTLSIPVQYAD